MPRIIRIHYAVMRHLFGVLLLRFLAETERAFGGPGQRRSTDVGSHNQDGILEIDFSALRVGQHAVLQHLQQDIEDIGVCLFDLVKQHHGVGATTDFFGQLTALLVPHISTGRPDEFRDAVLFHILGHIEPDERFDRFKHLAGKALDQLRLADTGRADEDKRNRVLFDLTAPQEPAGPAPTR